MTDPESMSDERREIAVIDERERRRRNQLILLCDEVRRTMRIQPYTPDGRTDGYIAATNRTAEVLAPFVEALDILHEIIYASDLCHGHRGCEHSMEPWQKARALIIRLDQEETERRYGQ